MRQVVQSVRDGRLRVAGATGYMTKPIQVQRLLELVQGLPGEQPAT